MVLIVAAFVFACETPPSKYIPPPEPREIPNVDPPPGIPIMSASGAKPPPPAPSAAPILLDGGAKPPKKRKPK